MDLTEPLKFEQQQITKLSQAIRKGARRSNPVRMWYLSEEKGECFACVLGAAALGCGYTHTMHKDAMGGREPVIAYIQKELGVPREVLLKAEYEWTTGSSREAIADRLESMGY